MSYDEENDLMMDEEMDEDTESLEELQEEEFLDDDMNDEDPENSYH